MTRAQTLFAFFSQLHQKGRCPKWINEVRLGRDRSRKTGRVKEPVRKLSSIIVGWQSPFEKHIPEWEDELERTSRRRMYLCYNSQHKLGIVPRGEVSWSLTRWATEIGETRSWLTTRDTSEWRVWHLCVWHLCRSHLTVDAFVRETKRCVHCPTSPCG